MDTDKMADKIAQLLAKAEKVGPEEAEALTAAAVERMQKYGITKAAIEARRAGNGNSRADEKIVKKRIELEGIYSKIVGHGFNEVLWSLGELRMLIGTYKNSAWVTVIGYEADVDQAVLLLNSLHMQSVVALQVWWKGLDHRPTGTPGWTMRKSFVTGFFRGAARRISDNKRKVVQAVNTEVGPGTELVLANRDTAVQAFLDDLLKDRKKVKTARAPKIGYDGLFDGIRAGRNANTGDSQITGSHNAIGG